MGPLRLRKTIDLNTETTMCQTTRSFNKPSLAPQSGSLTARGADTGYKPPGVTMKIKKVYRMNSESQLKNGMKSNLHGLDDRARDQISVKPAQQIERINDKKISIRGQGKDNNTAINLRSQRHSQTDASLDLKRLPVLDEPMNGNKKLELTVEKKKKKFLSQEGVLESKKLGNLKEEEFPQLNTVENSEVSSAQRNRTKSLTNNAVAKRIVIELADDNIAYEDGPENREIVGNEGVVKSDQKTPQTKKHKSIRSESILHLKSGDFFGSNVSTPRVNVLRIMQKNDQEKDREPENQIGKEDRMRNSELINILPPNLDWQGITIENAKLNKSVSSQGSNTEKEGKRKEDDSQREAKSIESPADAKKKRQKTLKKKVLALRIGRSFIASLNKKEPESSSGKAKQKELQAIAEVATPPRKQVATTPDNEPPLVKKMSKEEILQPKAKPIPLANKPKETNHTSSKKSSKERSLHKSSTEVTKTPPIINVLTVESSPKTTTERKESRNSRRSSHIGHIDDRHLLGGRRNSEADTSGRRSPERKKTLDNPKSWFNFNNKKLGIKLKKLSSFRINNSEVLGGVETQTEFIIFFDQTLRNSYKALLNNSQILPKQTETTTEETAELGVKSTGLARQTSKIAINVEEHEDTKLEMADARRNISEIETTAATAASKQSLPAIQISQLAAQPNEDVLKNSLKMYSKRDGIITININPPAEEVALDTRAAVSSGYNSPQKFLEGIDNTTPENVQNSEIYEPTKVIHFSFNMVSRKTMEEDSHSLDISQQSNRNGLNESFRKTTEDLFKFDEIYKSAMDNFNTKSQRLRIRSNFLSFIERIIVTPVEGWIHTENVTNIMLQQTKKTTSSVANNYHNNGAFEYKTTTFPLHYDPFQNEFIFLLNQSNSKLQIRPDNKKESEYFMDDDGEDYEGKLKNKTLIFSTGEIFKCEGNFDSFSEFKRTLIFNPILAGTNHDFILSMKDKLFDRGRDFKKDSLQFFHATSIQHLDLYNTLIKNDANWKHLKKCLLKMYNGALLGCFEQKVKIGKERILRDEDTMSMKSADNKLNKKRDHMVAGKMWRSGSIINPLMYQSTLKSKAIMDFILNKQSTGGNDRSTDEEERKSKKEILLGDNLKEGRQEKPRKYSKTSIKPIVHSNTETKKNLMNVINVEKSNTTVSERGRNKEARLTVQAPQNIMKMLTTTSNSETNPKAKLQIPRTESNRQAFSTSPFQRQETKVDPPEKKIFNKPTINYSLTPQSDLSPPAKDENPIDFSHQSTIKGPAWNRERTKTKIESSERGSLMRGEPSYGTYKEKEEMTTQQILWALQSVRKKEENTGNTIQKLGTGLKRELSNRSLMKRVYEQATNRSANNNNDEGSIVKAEKVVIPMAAEQTKAKKHSDVPLEKALFVDVYKNKFLEIREKLNFYPKQIIHVRDEGQNTLLMATAQVGYTPIAELLLQHGCELDAQNKDGNTALHIALAYHNYKLADLLVSQGAKQNVVNLKGKTAWET